MLRVHAGLPGRPGTPEVALSGDEPDLAAAREELRDYACSAGAEVFGVADASGFEVAPAGYRPADLLPGARRVVVVGGAAPRAGDWASPLHEHMESMGTSDRINSLGLKVAKLLESSFGYYALFVPPGVNRGNRPFLSIALAAELAGCASRSLAGPLLHPELGFLYYAAVVTTMPLPADRPLPEAACPAPACLQMWQEQGTTPCLACCPLGDGGCLGGEIVEGRVAARRFDAARCATRVYTHWVPGFQKGLEAVLDEPDAERRKMILYSSFFTRTLWSMTYAGQSQAQCYECMRVCPVGAERRELK